MATGFPSLNPARESKPVDFKIPFDIFTVKNKSALVTGGATGIGNGCAIALAEAGAYVTIVDVNEKDANTTVDKLTKAGYKAQFVKTDVVSWESQVSAFKAAVNFGPEKGVDIVIPAAGLGGHFLSGWLGKAELDDNGDPKPIVRSTIDVNLMGVFNTTHLALYYFREFPGPSDYDKQIIFVSSMAGYGSMPGAPDYASSKWGVRAIFRSLRGLHSVLGDDAPIFRCNLIAPGWIRTPMTKAYGYHELADQGKMAMAEVSDVVNVVMRLIADPNIIGRAVSINAGGNFDLGDDAKGLDAGKILNMRRAAPPSGGTETATATA